MLQFGRKTIFLSYRNEKDMNIELFVSKVSHCLYRIGEVYPYFAPDEKKAGDYMNRLINESSNSDYFVFFVSRTSHINKNQQAELDAWLNSNSDKLNKLAVVNINSNKEDIQLPSNIINTIQRIYVENINKGFLDCSKEILKVFDIQTTPFDGLPIRINALYEKGIINEYKTNNGKISYKKISEGYPEIWPKVKKFDCKNTTKNPLNENIYGAFRQDDSAISVDARHLKDQNNECSKVCKLNLTFPEAGPRESILKQPNPLNVAILVSGGIAPGINSIIASIVERHKTYERNSQNAQDIFHQVDLYGCQEGFNSLCEIGGQVIKLDEHLIARNVNAGGASIPTARADQLLKDSEIESDQELESNQKLESKSDKLKKIVQNLANREISILYIIGGEGSMRAAHAISNIYHEQYPNNKLSVIGIPKTMDNDILWVWQSIGFSSAVEKARQIIIQLATEATSNPRVCIVQLFGSSSGYVVSHAALGSNVCDLALIPELKFSMKDVCEYMKRRLVSRRNGRNGIAYGLIVMAETAIPDDYIDYIHDTNIGLIHEEIKALEEFENNNRRVIGQTPDHLRNAGLKIVSKALESYIQNDLGNLNNYWKKYRVFTNEPRHLIRSAEPSINDVAYGLRLGTMAVDMAMAGYHDCMVSQWLTEYVVVPLELVVLGRKDVPLEGIFWKTVISKTGQIEYTSLCSDSKKENNTVDIKNTAT